MNNNIVFKKLNQIGNSEICPVVALLKENQLLIGLRNYILDDRTVSVWTIPGGRCDDRETAEQTLRRETKKERSRKNFQSGNGKI